MVNSLWSISFRISNVGCNSNISISILFFIQFQVELVNENLFEWYVRVYGIDPESELACDMQEQNIKFVLLHLTFPDDFPFSPPFMRVVGPKIEKGFVMKGGAICMELLTPRGWASACTIEAGNQQCDHKNTPFFNSNPIIHTILMFFILIFCSFIKLIMVENAVVMQFIAGLSKGRARIVRTEKSSIEFSKQTAEAAFRSIVRKHEKHGWFTPPLADG